MSTINAYERIRKWNQDRNNLEYDANLELDMLSEEANEFFTTANLVEMIDGYCDFVFVLEGTNCKFVAQKMCKVIDICSFDNFKDIKEWAAMIMDTMKVRLETALKAHFRARYTEATFSFIINQSLEAVIKANEAKGKDLDEFGKVIKGADFVKPQTRILDLLEQYEEI